MITPDDLLIPRGWIKAFGQMMCDEINAISRTVEVLDSKEKWGELRLVLSEYSPALDDVVEKYTTLSRHICIDCGKPDVPMMNFGWISPVCRNCWYKYGNRPYDECCSNVEDMPTLMITKRYDPQWKDEAIRRVDISKTVAAIRRAYDRQMDLR